MSALVLIPARYASSRFPGKPLATIAGKPMIQHVYENLNKSKLLEVYVVTDDDRVQKVVESFSGRCLRVDDPVSTGSERILLAFERYLLDKNQKIVINVQGDEPLIKAYDIERLYLEHEKNNWEIGTLYKRVKDLDDFNNLNRVKLVSGKDSQGEFALYFSRSSIPSGLEQEWQAHVGVYSYRADVLKKFNTLERSKLEKCESLEQLRALENGIKIHLLETKENYIGVDTLQDIEIVEGEIKSDTKKA